MFSKHLGAENPSTPVLFLFGNYFTIRAGSVEVHRLTIVVNILAEVNFRPRHNPFFRLS